MRLFLAGLRKLSRRLATWLTFGIAAGLLSLIFIAVGATADQIGDQPGGPDPTLLLSFPAAYDTIISFLLGLGGLLALIYGAAVAGSEWTWGTLKTAVARGESRAGYVLATFASVAVIVAIGLLLAFGVGVAAAIIGGGLAGLPAGNLGDAAALGALPDKLARAGLAVLSEGALGFAIATLARSQLAGIGAGIGLFFGEQFAGIFFADVVQYLPFDAANAVIPGISAGGPGGGGGLGGPALEPTTALLVIGAWLIGSLVVATLFTERAEISG